MVLSKYIPGVCNIGPAEIAIRKQAGWIGLSVTIVLWALFIWLDAPRIWRLALFIPTVISATGFLQAYMRFCVHFGFFGLFNFGKTGRTDNITQQEFRAKDLHKAWQIVAYSVLIGLAVALIAYGRLS